MYLTATIGGLTASTIVLSFLSQWYIITRLGLGTETDAYYAGLAISYFLLSIMSGSLSFVLVPLLATTDDAGKKEFVWTVLHIVAVVFGGIAVALIMLAHLWVPLLVPGFTVEAKALTVSLTRVLLIGMVFGVGFEVLWSFQYARQKFLRAQLGMTMATITALVVLIWALPTFGILAAAWSEVFRSGLAVILLLGGVGSYCIPKWRSSTVGESWRRIRPMLIGVAYSRTDLLVDQFLASMAPAGGLSLLSLTRQIAHAISRVLNRAIADPTLPRLARYAQIEDWRSVDLTYKRRLVWISILASTGFLGIVVFGKPTLNLIFGGRNFSEDEIILMWWLMIALTGVLFGEPIRQLLSNVFYADGDTITPVRVGAICFTFGAVLKVAGFYLMGIPGIAIGISAYYLSYAVVLYYVLLKRRWTVEPSKVQVPRLPR